VRFCWIGFGRIYRIGPRSDVDTLKKRAINQSFNQSLNHSLTQSLSHSVTKSLNHSISQSLNHSIAQSSFNHHSIT
jgi:hypothetical protein